MSIREPTKEEGIDERKSISDFLRRFTAYDLMPDSAKVVVVEASLSIYRAFRVMAENHCTSVCIWDIDLEKFTGVLTSSDIMRATIGLHQKFFKEGAPMDASLYLSSRSIPCPSSTPSPTLATLLDLITVREWKQKPTSMSSRPLLFGQPDTTLYAAVHFLFKHNIHRLPVIDSDGSVTHSITYRSISKFLVSKFRLPSKLLGRPILSLGIGDTNPVAICEETTLFHALSLLVKESLSVVPVLRDGQVVDVFSKYDFIGLSFNQEFISLSQPVSIALRSRQPAAEGLVLMPASVTLGCVLRMIASRGLHRLVLREEGATTCGTPAQPGECEAAASESPQICEGTTEGKLAGVVSLRHILAFLVAAVDESKLARQEPTAEGDVATEDATVDGTSSAPSVPTGITSTGGDYDPPSEGSVASEASSLEELTDPNQQHVLDPIDTARAAAITEAAMNASKRAAARSLRSMPSEDVIGISPISPACDSPALPISLPMTPFGAPRKIDSTRDLKGVE